MMKTGENEKAVESSGRLPLMEVDNPAMAGNDINDDFIKSRIFTIRGVQVMLDRDMAALYGVETKVLNQAVKRNNARFPRNFMFQLDKSEMEDWKSQIVTSNLHEDAEPAFDCKGGWSVSRPFPDYR